MKNVKHNVDLCVVGGGLSGMAVAIAAARQGTKVLLMHDRPVLGGNASSEIRMWVRGAHGDNNLETGIMEEINLENLYRNPTRNYYIWDSILFEKIRFQENIRSLLNCSCTEATMENDSIKSLKGWQLTTETWHTVEAKIFADCSGDSILAPLTGADFRIGREARSEFGESIEPEEADKKTMGMSCLLQARETDRPQEFIPPKWAYTYKTEEELANRSHDIHNHKTNFWWIELGGEQDSIHDTETIRDELLKIAFGVWDHIKNRGDHGADNWMLDWVGFLPGKRESRRYLGDHILTQNDISSKGKFDDLVAYGGWTMDDHHPGGMNYSGKATIHHPAPSPFGIPYRSLYSRNIENLFCAGRNISTTHAGLSATRVMATCATVGQAVGTAAAIAVKDGFTPRGVYENRIGELKQLLMETDCYLPWNRRDIPEITKKAELIGTGEAENLRNGLDRPIGDSLNGWQGQLHDSIEYHFKTSTKLTNMRFIFDSNLNRPEYNMPASYPLNSEPHRVPSSMLKAFKVEAKDENGNWNIVIEETNNYQRFVQIPLSIETTAIRFTPLETWGDDKVTVFSWDVS